MIASFCSHKFKESNDSLSLKSTEIETEEARGTFLFPLKQQTNNLFCSMHAYNVALVSPL